ncbi:MAG: hypothetical protein LBT21_08050 [Oscillospiraceae bacterium]|jgi:hypothetical protein|nr:hypothetical protein [Oscillospiraceae bacterium]
MAWVEMISGERIAKKHNVRTQLANKISTLESVADDINELIRQINYVMDGSDNRSTPDGWLRCCQEAREENILGGGRAKEALVQACDVLSSLSDCEWEWVKDA